VTLTRALRLAPAPPPAPALLPTPPVVPPATLPAPAPPLPPLPPSAVIVTKQIPAGTENCWRAPVNPNGVETDAAPAEGARITSPAVANASAPAPPNNRRSVRPTEISLRQATRDLAGTLAVTGTPYPHGRWTLPSYAARPVELEAELWPGDVNLIYPGEPIVLLIAVHSLRRLGGAGPGASFTDPHPLASPKDTVPKVTATLKA
jgi:hypothetical protein